MTTRPVDPPAAPCPVYLGAVRYEAGELVALEEVIPSDATRARLRHADHGADTLARSSRSALELAQAAIEACLTSDARPREAIDAVILASNGLDAAGGLDLAWLGESSRRLGLSRAVHYHVGMAGCAGFHWAARLAASLVAADQCDSVLIVTFDKGEGALQRLYGEDTDFPYLTGDAAAACLVGGSPQGLDYRLQGKVVNVWDGEQAIRPSLDAEVGCIYELLTTTCASAGLSMDDVDTFITNNYSLDMSRLYCQIAGVGEAKAFTQTIATHAHCFGSDNLINLYHAQKRLPLTAGQRAMLFSAGPFQWGACVLEKL